MDKWPELQRTGRGQCAVIVAHPDDETLWAGGTILMHSDWTWTILSLCRKSDPERSGRFYQALGRLRASGQMGDLDDGPDQIPLEENLVRTTLLSLLPRSEFDLILTHSPQGEYIRHRRHEEVAATVIRLIEDRDLKTGQLWLFAYANETDGDLSRPIPAADRKVRLPQGIWSRKHDIMTTLYGFPAQSWEVRTLPRSEAFWTFAPAKELARTVHQRIKTAVRKTP